MKRIKVKLPKVKGYRYALIDDEDLERVAHYKWHHSGKLYPCTNLNRVTTGMHRIIMNAKSGDIVDHINGNGYDNRKSNLRFCTTQQNSHNTKKKLSNNTSGFRGVSWHKRSKKWQATIAFNKVNRYLGVFNSRKKAFDAYKKASIELFGKFSPYKQHTSL